MKESTPQTIYLKDYVEPDYLIESVELRFELDKHRTRIHSVLQIVPNPARQTLTTPLNLHGEELELQSIQINNRELDKAEYQVTESNLCITTPPSESFSLIIDTSISPASNTQLQGLYQSNTMLCTQCEAQGFRRITYFLDQPDIMARFTTTLIADPTDYPILLSNGNPIKQGAMDDGRHWVTWQDPFPKPAYLFAIVAGQLEYLEDTFTTTSGRSVKLQIFVEAHDIDKCDHAMRSLKASMSWDEQQFGREYDLDLYMIVAVSHFNMGAMENKGLNIFNTQYVLARPDTATDSDYEHIEGVIGHEYFHNWTGNRITCRDWFQLSLKEGLTVFRDQQFTADQTSAAVKRINDVNALKTRQFAEDAGPLAHPVRPASYIEINNFYTSTVYEKGAEVVRMIHTITGPSGFRAGMDEYFKRHDGQAVTTDDFVKCMEDANQIDLTQFKRWYEQAGTPELTITTSYDEHQQKLTLQTSQHCPPTPGQPHKSPFHIPLRLALFDQNGQPIALNQNDTEQSGPEEVLLNVDSTENRFDFYHVKHQPVVSALRGFSAPVKLKFEQTAQELAFLARHDNNPFNRWSAIQNLSSQIILSLSAQPNETVDPLLFSVYESIVTQALDDLSYLAVLLMLPTEQYLANQVQTIDPEGIHRARQSVKQQLATHLSEHLLSIYRDADRQEQNEISNQAAARRKLKNVCLNYLAALNTRDSIQYCLNQFKHASNMTDEIAALSAIVHNNHPDKERCLDQFYQKWNNEALVIDKWFSIQATSPLDNTLDAVKTLTRHSDFDLGMPNRVRSLINAFSVNNPLHFHNLDGSGYSFLTAQVNTLDQINPQIAARLVTPLTQWQRHSPERQKLMKLALETLLANASISRDLFEIVSKSL
ncbi:MAG: aminopeptidase N [Gammaproteobacteria bacterium]|nr:aminopeptidase N [Gammaproteobacteria bacterium]